MADYETEFGSVPLEKDEDGNWVIKKGQVSGSSNPLGAAGAEDRLEQRYQNNMQKVSSQHELENQRYGSGVDRFQEYKRNPPMVNLVEHAKSETVDMALGIKDLINGLTWAVTEDPEEKDRLLEEHHAVQTERDNMKEYYEPLELSTWGSKVGKMIPYIAAGGAEGAIGRTIISPLATAEKLISRTAKTADSMIPKSVTSKINPDLVTDLKTVGDMATKGYDKLNELPVIKSMRKDGNWTNEPYYDQWKPTLVGTMATGAVEGAIQPGSGPVEGLVTNFASNLMGKKAFSAMRGVPNENPDNVNDLIKQGIDNGYTLEPGIKLGNRTMQQNEAKMAGAGEQAQVMYRNRLENQDVTNEHVWDWLGLDKASKGQHVFTPDVLKEHRYDLKGQYDETTNNSTGHWTKDGIDQLTALEGHYAKQPGIFSEEISNAVRGHIKQFQETRQTARGPDGRYRQGQFSGRQFQDWDTALRSDINAAFAANKPEVAYALKDVQNTLGEALTDGIELFGSKADADDWKKLNKQWYMFNTLEEVGIDPKGDVHLEGLLDHFMSTDRKNFLEDNSMMMNPLYGMAKLRGVLRDAESAQLGGTSLEGVRVRDEIPQMVRAKDNVMDLVPLMKHKAYMGKYGPAFGTKGSGTGDPGVYGMAADQAFNVHEGLFELADDIYGEGRNLAEGYTNWRENATNETLKKDIGDFNTFVQTSLLEFLMGEEDPNEAPTQDPNGAMQ